MLKQYNFEVEAKLIKMGVKFKYVYNQFASKHLLTIFEKYGK